MIMMVKEVVLLWMVARLAASAEILVDDSNKTLANIPSSYSVNITSLLLHHNHIVMNSSDILALKKYTNLTKLDLSYNFISELPEGAFSALSSLQTLSLTGNKLQTIRNETFTDLKKLKTLDLAENPWNCTQELVALVKWMNGVGLQTGPNATCATPVTLAGKRIQEVFNTSITKLPPVTTTKTTSTFTTVTTSTKNFITTQSSLHQELTTVNRLNISSKDTEAEKSGKSVETNSWKFLTGVIIMILCTSMVIVCAVKSPIWYKMVFDYRHQRLHEAEEPSIFNTGRYSNFSLDTEQTETSAHELDQGFTELAEDEDGFIEDGYIQPEDYKEHTAVDEV